MNIVLYVSSFLPTIGGMEIVVHYLADAYLQLGHNVRVVCSGGWWSQRRLHYDYPVHRWPTLTGSFSEKEWFVKLFLDSLIWGCDILHAHTTYPTGYLGCYMKRFRDIPLVLTPHGEDIHVVPEIGFGMRLDPRLRPKISRALEGADILTAISANVEASLLEAGGQGEKIRRISNGVDMERFQRSVQLNVRKELAVPEDSRLIVTVGNYHLRKGHEVLVRSMPRILSEEPRARLVIVGRNNEALRPLIEELNLREQVKLTGAIAFPFAGSNGSQSPRASKPDYLADIYRTSDLYVSAGMSEGSEGLSLAVLDAMAAGLPVVASDISGNRDIVRDAENGFLVQPGEPRHLADAVLRILRSPNLRKSMGEEARNKATRYEWKEVALQYLAVYAEAGEMCKRRPRRLRQQA
jgi:glycosyltransferase involved in cell wall biosynthesis